MVVCFFEITCFEFCGTGSEGFYLTSHVGLYRSCEFLDINIDAVDPVNHIDLKMLRR